MLKPSMNELMKRVGNRYLLVNLTAQRARDIAQDAEQGGQPLPDKVVKLALDEIAAGTIVHRPGKKPEPPVISLDLDRALDADPDFEEDPIEEEDEEIKDFEQEEE